MKKLFESWRRYLNETPYGGYNPGLAGTLSFSQGTSRMTHKLDKKDPPDEVDTKFVVKAVVHRSGEAILLRNKKGWDLPGGHKKRNEGDKEALRREVFEETGVQIDVPTMEKIGQKGNKTFYKVEYTSDAFMQHSDEHTEITTYTLEQIQDLNEAEIDPFFKKILILGLGGEINE